MQIKECIVVEGRNDLIRLRSCVEADILLTSGYGLNPGILAKIRRAYERQGIIIFTDPDFVGERIRRELSRHFPKARHAYISREEGSLEGDVGVENASCQSILRALSKVHTLVQREPLLTMQDMIALGLSGGEGASAKREALGKRLGLGSANAKTFLFRLNHSTLSEEDLEEALREILPL